MGTSAPTTQRQRAVAPDFIGDWRKSEVGNGHMKRFTKTLESGFRSDVTFLIGNEKKEFKVHKLVLSIGSAVFDELFNANKDVNSFEILDLEPDEFSLLLKFLYAGESSENIEDGLPMMKAATRYKVFDLIRICEELLGSILTAESALRMLQQSMKYRNAELEEKALKCICKHGQLIINSAEFLELSEKELRKILARDDLEIINEIQLFEAVMKWGRVECKRRQMLVNHKYVRSVLEKILHLLRFPLMDPSDFSLKVAPTEILLMEEVMSVLLYFNIKPEQRSKAPSGVFSTKLRAIYTPTGKVYILKRLVTCKNNFHTSRRMYMDYRPSIEHSIRFQASIPIWVTSIGMNRTNDPHRNHCQDTVTVKIQLKDAAENVLETQTENVNEVQSRTDQVYHIQFKKPVFIEENQWNIASFTTVSGAFYGARYKARDGVGSSMNFELLDGSGKVVNFKFQNDDSNPNKITGTLKVLFQKLDS